MLIFYEVFYCLLESLVDMCDVFGGECCVVLVWELSKIFEIICSLLLVELYDWVVLDSNQQCGECVVLVVGWQVLEGEELIGVEVFRVFDLLFVELLLKKVVVLVVEIIGV